MPFQRGLSSLSASARAWWSRTTGREFASGPDHPRGRCGEREWSRCRRSPKRGPRLPRSINSSARCIASTRRTTDESRPSSRPSSLSASARAWWSRTTGASLRSGRTNLVGRASVNGNGLGVAARQERTASSAEHQFVSTLHCVDEAHYRWSRVLLAARKSEAVSCACRHDRDVQQRERHIVDVRGRQPFEEARDGRCGQDGSGDHRRCRGPEV